MLDTAIRILNFDNSVIAQKRLLEKYPAETVDLTGIGPAARLWADTATALKIESALKPGIKNFVTLLGSGDFHHMTYLLLRQFSEPLTLIVFDHHPDWDILPPRLGCGSWVSRALELPNIAKVVLLGPSSDDLASPAVHTANLRALGNGRVEIYPYKHEPTRVLLRSVPDNPSIALRRSGIATEIIWTELCSCDHEALMRSLLERCGTKKAYISIDKDCLRPEHSLTNWEEGRFGLDEMLNLLRLIKDEMEIVGGDITGEYSEPVIRGKIKSLCSRMDHPARPSAWGRPAGEITAVNERTNLRILKALLG